MDELEDEEEEKILLAMKAKRLQEMKQQMSMKKFGQVLEISAQDYVQEVNKAGEGVWVVLHLYKQGLAKNYVYVIIISNSYKNT